MAQTKLLFLDTFSHEITEGANINLDLVNFDEPVTIQELRIIPLGAQIEINPGGLRLGATNPMTFHLEAYAADVKSNKKLSTFQKIGSMEYQERNIQMIMDKHISTERFVLKGYFIAITVALYGVIDREVPQHHPQHITPHHHIQNIPTVKQEPHIQPIQSHDDMKRDVKPDAHMSLKQESKPLPHKMIPNRKEEPSIPKAEVKPMSHAVTSGSADSMNSQLYGAISATDLAEAPATDQPMNVGGEEDDPEIYSEEDVLAGDIITTDETGYDDGYEGYTDINAFNPYQFEVTPLSTYSNPSLTEYGQEKMRLADSETLNTSAERVLEILDAYRDQPKESGWVKAMEELGNILPSGLACLSVVDPAMFDSAMNTLTDWTLESLNTQSAMRQPETPFKVRHLKMGIKFAGQILVLYESLTTKLLELGVLDLLFSLFRSPYMATSLRLLIVKTMDELTQTQAGIKWFMGETSEGTDQATSGYQQLIDITLSKQNARIIVAVSALLRKLHCYEVLMRLQNCTNGIAERTYTIINSESQAKLESGEGGEQSVNSVTAEQTADQSEQETLSENEADIIITCLEEVLLLLKNANQIMSQPAQCSLPARKQFEVSHPPSDPYPGLMRMLSACKLLETLFVLLSSPLTVTEPDIFSAVRDVINQLLSSQIGLLFISGNVETVNCIIRSLIQTSEHEQDENSVSSFGLSLVFQLQALQFVDQLKESWSGEDEDAVDDGDLLAILHAMLGLTISTDGQNAIVNVLSFDLEPLMSLISPTGDDEMDKRIRSSTTAKYVNDFLQLVFMYTTDISRLKPHIPKLISLTKFDDSSKIFGTLLEWLEPYQEMGMLDYTCVSALTKQFHSYVDQLPKLEVGLVSCLRIMTSLALDKYKPEDESTAFATEELKYQRVLLELYSSDCLNGWIKIIERLSEKQLHSWQRGACMSGTDRDLLLFIIEPTLILMRSILSQVIEVRGTDFHDTSALEPLFRTFTVVCSVPAGPMDSQPVSRIQRLIIDILAAYTQPEIVGTESEINDAMTNSLWTSMLKQLLKYTMSHPCNYLSGTVIFSELLPLPLPIQCTGEPLSEEVVKLNINHRTLWCAHLLPMSTELEQYLTSLSGSSCLHLQHKFKNLCWQLSDLNHHFAQFVTKCLLKSLMDHLPATPATTPTPAVPAVTDQSAPVISNNQTSPVSISADVLAANTAGVLSYLVQKAPAKCALLSMLRCTKTDSIPDFGEMLNKLLITMNTVCEKPSHNHCQEHIVTMLQSLCDIELSLHDDLESVEIQTQLANELPDADTLQTIMSAFMSHIGDYDHCYASILQSLRTLDMFIDYSYTFNFLKRALMKESTSLYNLFTRLNNTFSKDSSDCISTLSTALELLRRLLIEPELQQQQNTSTDSTAAAGAQATAERNSTTQAAVSASELAQMVKWTIQPHPLIDLESLLVDLVDEQLEGIVANITSINQVLKSDDAKPKDEQEDAAMDTSETVMQLPKPATLQDQFSNRSVYVMCNSDVDKLSSYWLSNLMADDSNVDETDERIESDLLQLCEKYIKDFNLEDELKKTEAGLDNLAKVTIIHSRKNEVLALGQAGTQFKAPMRGLGVMKRGQMHRGRVSSRAGRDHFRDRAQNTSRPPSMHVDDFVKMAAHPPSDSAQEGRMGFAQRDMGGGGGRGGFDRGRGRSRFPTAPDGFKPNFRGGGFRGHRGGMRGSPNPRGGQFYNNRGGGRFGDNSPRFNRGGMMDGGMRNERRNFSQGGPGRYGDSLPQDRRSYTPRRGGMSDSRGGGGGMSRGRGGQSSYYSSSRDKGDRMGPPPGARDRDRSNHYRSYTK